MSASEVRAKVHQIVDQLDEGFLEVVHSMLDKYVEQKGKNPIISYDIDGTPRTASDLEKLLDSEVESALSGNSVSIEELRKKSDQWLADIK